MAMFCMLLFILMTVFPLVSLDNSPVPHCPPRCVCFHDLDTVDCSKSGLSIIPVIPKSAEVLILDNIHIGTLVDDIFCNLTQARLLSLKNCDLTIIKRHAFRGLTDLTSLILANNHLIELPDDLFSDVEGLETLDLTDTRLSLASLAPMLSGLKRLKLLDIRHIVIDVDILPDNISELTQLRTLRLGDEVMLRLPTGFFQTLENVSVIDLVISGKVSNVSEYVMSDMTSLQRIDVSGTTMTSSDGANFLYGLQNASKLNILIMDEIFNKVKVDSAIHKHFFQSLGALTVLSFQNNPFAFNGALLHRAFKPLKRLQRLYLDGCGIHEIHVDAFYGLKHLKYLSLRSNLLTCFDKSSCGFISQKQHMTLSNLEILDLSDNNIKLYSHELSFRGSVFPGLKELYLSHNKFNRLTEDMFHSLPKLNFLDLARNPVTLIEPGTFFDLPEMTTLHLNGTQVRHVVLVYMTARYLNTFSS